MQAPMQDRPGRIIMCLLLEASKEDESMEAVRPAARRAGCVLAVDDQPAFRSALRFVVAACRALVLTGEADSGEAAIVLVAELEPDLVLMDVQMPGIGGIAATREIKRLRQRTVVLLVSATHPDELPPESTECSADGIIWKGDLRPNILETIWAKHAYTRV